MAGRPNLAREANFSGANGAGKCHTKYSLNPVGILEWTDCVQSDIRAFGITGDWKAMALKAKVWVEAITDDGWRFMAAWRK